MGAPGEWMLGPVLGAILVTVALAGCALLKRRHRTTANKSNYATSAPPPGNVVEPESGAIISPFATRASRPSRTSHELNDVFNRTTLPAAHSSISGIQSSLSVLPPTWVSGTSNKQHSGNLNQASEADRALQLPDHGSSRFTRSPSQGTTRSASLQHAPPPDVLEALLAVNQDCVEGGSGLIAWPRNQSPQNADAAGGAEEAPNRGHTWIQGLTKDSFLLTHETQATNNGPGSSGGGYMLRTGTQHLQVSQLADPTWPHFMFGNPLQVTVGELLGRGGCGAVYAGIWRDKPVAVKVVQQVVNAAAAAAAAAATVDTAIDVAPKDAAAAARAAFRRLPLSGFASPVSTHGAARGRGSSDTPRPTGDPTDPDSAALPQPLQLVPQQPLQPHRLSQPSLPQPGDYRNPDRNLGLRIAPGVTATASCGAGMASTAAVSDSMSLSTAETPPVGARRRPMLGDAAASVKKLRHPNVLRTYAYASMCMAPQAPPPPGRSGGYGAPLPPPPFIRHEHHVLLELCDGGSLRMWLDQHSRALEQLTSGGGGGGGSGAVRNAAKAALEQDATVTLGTLGTVGTVGTAADVGSVSLLPGTFMLNTAAGLPIPSPSPSPLVPQFSIPAQRYSLTGALTTLTAIGGVEAWVEATVAAAEAVATAVVSPAPPAEPVLEATPPGTPLTTIYSAAFPRKDMPSRRAGSTSGPPLPPLPPPASQPALSALPMFTPLKPHFTGYESEQVQGPTTVSHGTLSTLPSLAGPSGLQAKLSSSAWHTAHGASGCATSLPSETAATTSAAASTEAGVPCHNSSADVPGERRLAAPRLDRQLSGAAHERVSLAHAPSCSSDALTLRHQPSIDPALAGAPFGSAAANTTSSTTTNGPTVAGSDACSSPQPIPRTSSLNWDVNAPPDSVVRAWVGASELTRIAEDRPAGQADMDTDTDPDPDRVREHEEGDMMGPTHAMYAPTGAHVHGTSRTGTQAGTMGQGGSDATPLRGTLMIGDEADGADGQDPDDLTSVTVSALSEPSASVVSNPFTTGASLGAVGAGSGAGLRARLLRNQAGLGGSVGVVADGVAAAGRRGPGCNSTSSWLGGRSGDMTCPPGMAMAIGMGMGGSTSGMVSGAGLGSSAVGREHVAAWALEVGSTGGQGRYATGVKGLWTPGAASSSQGVGMETAEGLGWTTTLDSVSVPASVPGGTPVRSGTPVRMREAVEAAGGASPEGAAGSPLAPVVLRSAPCGAGGGAVGAGSELAGDGAVAGKEPAAAGGRAGAQGLARVVEEASCGGSVSVAARRDKDARGSTGQQNGGGGGNSCGDGTSAAAGGSSHSTSATAGYSSYYYSNDPTVGSGRVFNGSLGASGRGTHKGGPRMWPSAAAGAASGQHTAGGAPWRANAADNSNNNSFFGRRSPGPGPAGFCFPFPNQDPDTASAPVASSKRSPFSPPLPLVPEGVSQRLSAHQALLQDANTLPLKPETQQAAAWVGSGLAQQRAATSGGTAASRRSAAGDATSSHTTVNTRPGSSSTSNNSDIRLVPVPGLGPPYASRRHRAWVRQGTTRRHPLLSAAVSSSTAALDAFMLPAHPSVTGGLQQPLSHNLHTPHLAQNLHQHQLLHRNASLAGGTTTTNGTNVATGTHNSSAFQVVSQRCIVVDSGDDDDDVGGIYDLLEEDGEGEAAAGGAGGAGGRVEGWEERRGGVPARGSASDEVTLAGSSRVAGGSSAAQTGADSVGQVQGASGGMQDQQLQQGSAHLLPQSQSSEQRSLSQRTGLSPETSTSQPMLGARFDLLPAQRSPDLQPTLAAGAAPFTAAAPTNAHPTVSPGDAALPLATRSPTPPSPAPAAVPRGPSADPDILNQLNRRAVSMVRSILQAAANNAAGPGENNNNANGGQATGQATADAAAEGEAGAGAQGGRRLQAPPRALCAAPPDGAAVLESLGMRREQLGYLCLALDCLVEAASGLAYLHDQGIVHGDIKASNLLLKLDPQQPKGIVLKLADFGFSRELDHGSHTYLSRPSGTLAYLAPELLTQYRQSAAADLYAFGLLVYEVATTHQLFKGLQVAQVLFAKAHNADWQHLKWPAWCPTDVREVARGCSLFHPADRLTAADALDRLRQLRTRYCCLLLATRQGHEQDLEGQREQGAVLVEG